ncbi:transcriptional activator FtrA [Vibrio ruber DSM 16370]|uniref:Transcriptional activator FtrA n=1 Tax=Vibrio ruber (strain DSM 16370 / JCM 11486 / BCRC 17186 / CECT 7878 / LMG 23124 / VR1) TaxID=1123498 RepID=A0A1R4LT18_VIBR1|nr:AraC family transcriptional regulator [Vibrio ruber]SJN59742.1 transcriptional activator FtrA [Vibrio ruber DSM 16370]
MSTASIVSRVAAIHAKQPWFVLSAAQDFSLCSSEIPEVSHFYSFEADQSAALTLAIPDGCIDILFDCDANAPAAYVCGTTLEATRANFVHQHRYFGVRFLPGVIPDFLDASAREMVNHLLYLPDVVPTCHALFEQVVSTSTFVRQVSLTQQFLKDKFLNSQRKRRFSPLTVQAIQHIFDHKGNIQIKQLEAMTGYTSRTLQRQFLSDLGLSPKAFSRIIRCQSAVYHINHHRQVVFSDLAYGLGFSDQAHFLREFKRLVSATPLDYQKRVKHETYLSRIRYN